MYTRAPSFCACVPVLRGAQQPHADACSRARQGRTASLSSLRTSSLVAQSISSLDQSESEAEQKKDEKPEWLTMPPDAAWFQAKQQNREAQYVLGMCYLHGVGQAESVKNAAVWLAKAAGGSHPAAQFQMAMLWLKGGGVPRKDEDEASRWMEKAAKGGNADALFHLGVMSLHGRGVPESAEAAIVHFRAAADAGSAEAQFHLGGIFERCAPEIHRLWNTPGVFGDGDQLFEIANRHLPVDAEARKVPPLRVALELYSRAGEQGHGMAQHRAAILVGQGVQPQGGTKLGQRLWSPPCPTSPSRPRARDALSAHGGAQVRRALGGDVDAGAGRGGAAAHGAADVVAAVGGDVGAGARARGDRGARGGGPRARGLVAPARRPAERAHPAPPRSGRGAAEADGGAGGRCWRRRTRTGCICRTGLGAGATRPRRCASSRPRRSGTARGRRAR